MASPGNHVVRNGETATYHVWSRCVRLAFLCGTDPYTGRNFDYRRTWIVKLLEHLAGTFGVNVVSYNVLSNHQHLIASTRWLWSLTNTSRWRYLRPPGWVPRTGRSRLSYNQVS